MRMRTWKSGLGPVRMKTETSIGTKSGKTRRSGEGSSKAKDSREEREIYCSSMGLVFMEVPLL